MSADPHGLHVRYPIAASIVDRLNLSGRRRYQILLNREYASDFEATVALVTASANHVSGEHGLILGAFVEHMLGELAEVRAQLDRKANKAGRPRKVEDDAV